MHEEGTDVRYPKWLGLLAIAVIPAVVLAGEWKWPWKPAPKDPCAAGCKDADKGCADCAKARDRKKTSDDEKECNYVAPREVTSLRRLNSRLRGRIVDHTYNHGFDRRIFSPSLMEFRDLYVYLPPNYDPTLRYPLIIYLHGILQDERGFADQVAPVLDRAIVSGRMPPVIVAAPDGSLDGNPSKYGPGSFFINGPAGDFQDWVTHDVWNFMVTNYPIRPEPEAHILAGVSMGGFGAVNIAIKNRDRFRIAIAALPVLNLRWMNLCGNYHADFDPYNWGWRNSAYDPEEVLGVFYNGWYKVRVKDVIYPVFGAGPDGIFLASQENPIEMIDRYKLKRGELDLFIAYGQQDEFNLDAQAESFLYFLKSRGIPATVYVDPEGTHSEQTARKMLTPILDWLAFRLTAHGVAEPMRDPQVKMLP
jgi:acetyl esterase/lipase